MAPEIFPCRSDLRNLFLKSARKNQEKNSVEIPFFKGAPADMYSLGVLLFTMYFGFPPLKHSNYLTMNETQQLMFEYMVSDDPNHFSTFLLHHPYTTYHIR